MLRSHVAETLGTMRAAFCNALSVQNDTVCFNRAIKFPLDSRVRETAKNYCKTIYLAAG